MTKYDKFKVTAQSRLEGNEDKVTLYVPKMWLEDVVTLLLDNCMTVDIDAGIRGEAE